ncbi:MAG TPA: uroporphyrinogen-III synthase [Acidimicrobiales bacterium]|nr:uroporphyrinogen-III synthase [Acidimicrobiales bacterium]
MTLGPLDGFVVGITADRRWQEQAELLERRGASILHGPTMTTQYLASDEDLRRATQAVLDEPPDYVVATTGIGMRAWLEAAAAWGLGDLLAGVLARTRIVARGPKAAAAVHAAGIDVWARSSTEQMDALVDLLLAEPLPGRRVAVQEYGMPSPELTAALGAAGAAVVEVPVYRWRLPDDIAPVLRLVEAACDGRVDAITFTSAPAVHNLFAIAERHGVADRLRRACNGRVVVACVGPVCADGALKEGIADPLAPSVGRLGLLVRALSDRFEAERRTFTLGGVPVTLQGSAVEVGGERAELSPRERGLFEALVDAGGTVVARSALLDRVWGSPDADPHVLEVTVGRLRRRVGPAGAGLRAVAGRGYRLDGLGPAPRAVPL